MLGRVTTSGLLSASCHTQGTWVRGPKVNKHPKKAGKEMRNSKRWWFPEVSGYQMLTYGQTQHLVGNVVWEDSCSGEKREEIKVWKGFIQVEWKFCMRKKYPLSSTGSTKQQYKLIVTFRKWYYLSWDKFVFYIFCKQRLLLCIGYVNFNSTHSLKWEISDILWGTVNKKEVTIQE